jgi:hypothetical protein
VGSIEEAVEGVIEDKNEEVIDQVGDQRYSRSVVVGWITEEQEYRLETMRYWVEKGLYASPQLEKSGSDEIELLESTLDPYFTVLYS